MLLTGWWLFFRFVRGSVPEPSIVWFWSDRTKSPCFVYPDVTSSGRPVYCTRSRWRHSGARRLHVVTRTGLWNEYVLLVSNKIDVRDFKPWLEYIVTFRRCCPSDVVNQLKDMYCLHRCYAIHVKSHKLFVSKVWRKTCNYYINMTGMNIISCVLVLRKNCVDVSARASII